MNRTQAYAILAILAAAGIFAILAKVSAAFSAYAGA